MFIQLQVWWATFLVELQKCFEVANFVPTNATESSFPSLSTYALKTVDSIHTSSLIETNAWSTVVDICNKTKQQFQPPPPPEKQISC